MNEPGGSTNEFPRGDRGEIPSKLGLLLRGESRPLGGVGRAGAGRSGGCEEGAPLEFACVCVEWGDSDVDCAASASSDAC